MNQTTIGHRGRSEIWGKEKIDFISKAKTILPTKQRPFIQSRKKYESHIKRIIKGTYQSHTIY